MFLCYYNALPHSTNIYSLSQFEVNRKQGCIISTSKHLYHLTSRKNGEVKLTMLKLSKVNNISDIEIQSQTSIYYKSNLYISFIYRIRKESDYTFILVSSKYRNQELYTPEHSVSTELSYTPYKIQSVKASQKVIEDQLLILVCGNNTINSKSQIVYDPETLKPVQSRLSVDDFSTHKTPVTALSTTWSINQYIVAIGCQNGDITLVIYENEVLEHTRTLKLSIDGPVSSVILFETEPEIVDLLALSAVGYCIVFRDIMQYGFDKRVLIRPKSFDALTCAVTADVDFDGQKEIIIGCFSKDIYCYKLGLNGAEELWKIELMTPIFCLCDVDINKDGINELVVVTMFGLSVFNPSHDLALKKLQDVRRYLENMT